MSQIIVDNDPNKFSTNVLKPQPVVKKRNTFNRLYGKHDVLDGEYRLSQKIVAELLGTMIFVYGVCCCNCMGLDTARAVICSCFFGGVIIYIFGRVSGAHFNPAVSLGLFIRHKLTALELVLYIVAQIVGGFIGAVLVGLCRRGKYKYLGANSIPDSLYSYENTNNKNGWYYVSPFLFEILGTFLLIMFILASCERDNYLGPTLGFAFSSVLVALSGLGGGISGCSLNPARSFGPALLQVMAGGSSTPMKQIWIYLVGPLLGAVIAAFVWPIFVYQF